MSEEADEDEAPAVALGEETSVAGAPLARIAARFTWPIEKSEIRARDGETEIRTADGPTPLGTVLEDIDDSYFATRRHFVTAVRDQLPQGSVSTAEE